MKRIKCYIYTRVSTSMQVDGYSLDAQKEKLRKYAAYQDMIVAGEYCDEGKSGKSIEGRPEFLRMLRDVESGADGVSFVLVFKLSRFGRNAADVLTSLQRMQDFGVNLICVEDGIDSSKDSGKLMISVLSAVAEIERENILVQTMEGRRQKAREGKWNGGFAPYGYKLVDGQLQIAEEEAQVIRIIYDKYIHTTMSTATARSAATTTRGRRSRAPFSSACWTTPYTAASWPTGAGAMKRCLALATSTTSSSKRTTCSMTASTNPSSPKPTGSWPKNSASRPTSARSRRTAWTTSTSFPGWSSAPSAAVACTAT